jgi:hypothetical protein
LLSYWGRFGGTRAYKPLMESLTRVPEGTTINVSTVLSALSRARGSTRIRNLREPNVMRQDCFWSAMNFFNDEPDNRFFDSEYTQKILRSDYDKLRDGEKQFGDILLLLGPANKGLAHVRVCGG